MKKVKYLGGTLTNGLSAEINRLILSLALHIGHQESEKNLGYEEKYDLKRIEILGKNNELRGYKYLFSFASGERTMTMLLFEPLSDTELNKLNYSWLSMTDFDMYQHKNSIDFSFMSNKENARLLYDLYWTEYSENYFESKLVNSNGDLAFGERNKIFFTIGLNEEETAWQCNITTCESEILKEFPEQKTVEDAKTICENYYFEYCDVHGRLERNMVK